MFLRACVRVFCLEACWKKYFADEIQAVNSGGVHHPLKNVSECLVQRKWNYGANGSSPHYIYLFFFSFAIEEFVSLLAMRICRRNQHDRVCANYCEDKLSWDSNQKSLPRKNLEDLHLYQQKKSLHWYMHPRGPSQLVSQSAKMNS